MSAYAWVALGAVVGAPLRYTVERLLAAEHPRASFPRGLFAVNVLGSALAGIVVATTDGNLRLVLLIGFCGAFTTYSGFGWAATQLWGEQRRLFWLTVLGVTAACIAAFTLTWSISLLLS